MGKAAILGGLFLVVAGFLVLLNPRLLVAVVVGLVVGVAARWLWALRTTARAPRPTSPAAKPRLTRPRRVALALGTLVVVLLLSVSVNFLSIGVAPSPRPTVGAALTFQANYDATRATWTASERYDLSDDAVDEALRLLAKAGRSIPTGATPDDVAMLLGTEFGGDGWTVGLLTGRPTLTRSSEIRMPEGGPWSYDVGFPLAAARGLVLDIQPAGRARAVLDTPRHLVLQAAPPIVSSEALSGDARETVRIDVPDDATVVRLDVAPAWARHDVTAWAMTASLGNLTQLGVGAIVAAIATGFGGAIWSWMKSIWLRFRRSSPASASGATRPRPPAEDHAVGPGERDPHDLAKPARLIKILFLAANPVDTDQLRLDEEMRAIDQALREAEFRDRFEIEQQWAVRIGDLQTALLRHRPDIVHFSGHGDPASEIFLEGDSGVGQAVPSDDLSRLFSVLRDNIRCVVLNACYSEEQAQAIAEHIDCVVGMTSAVGDDAAIEFATGFYRAIGYGRDVQTAFDLGANLIGLRGLPDVDTPHLVAKRVSAKDVSFVQPDP